MANGWWERTGAGRDPFSGRFVPPTEDPFLGRLTTQSLTEQILIQVRAATGAAIGDQAYERLRAGLYEWARVMGQEEGDRKAIELMNEGMAKRVQNAVIIAYQGAQNRGRRLPSYRFNDKGKMHRYANKAMLNALKDKAFIDSDYQGIRFPNTQHMDNAAKQWYRLNFGAAPKPANPVSQPNMKFGQYETKTSLSFNGFKPSKKFNVPSTVGGRAKGVWSKTFLPRSPAFTKSDDADAEVFFSKSAGNRVRSGYTGAFNPALAKSSALYVIPRGAFGVLGFESRTSKGIVGQRFLDAGARFLNEQYGQELSKLLNEWGRKANRAGKTVAEKRTGVKVNTTWDAKRVERKQLANKDLENSLDVTIFDDVLQFGSYQDFLAAGGDLADFKAGQVSRLRRLWGDIP